LLIKGDNLEVLKHMVNAYSEKVKMIYIDPPYNTGGDGFVYNDDRKFSKNQLSELAGIELDEAERILEFTCKGSNSHSAWLTFMYPRLYIARELLSDDGVVFISIDDNEISQLKIICDEVFGEQNFLGQFIVNSSPSAIDYGHIAKTHEYALFYAKDSLKTTTKHLEDEDKVFKYKDSIGAFNLYPLYNGNVAFNPITRPNLHYPFYLNPVKKTEQDFYEIGLEKMEGWVEVFPVISRKDKISRVWRWGKPKAKENLNNEIVGYQTDQGEYRVVQKTRLTGKMIRSLHIDKDVSTRKGTSEVQELFNNKVFSFPKPVSLIKRFIESSTFANDIILDFFSGSGTTAHAVMQYCAEHKESREFIAIQIDEKTSTDSIAHSEGFNTIFDITKARIIKAAEKIKETTPEYKGDFGFKIFEAIEDFRVTTDEELTLSNLTMFDDEVLTEKQYTTLLTTWSLYDGSLLTTPIDTIELNNYNAHYCDGRLYLIAPDFSTESLKVLLTKLDLENDFSPHKIVFYGNNFESAKQMELNEALKSYANKKSLEIEIVARY
jgi:adenine-specific DNA-methyltransferase